LERAGYEDLLQRGRAAMADTTRLQTRARAGLAVAGQRQTELRAAIAVVRARARPSARQAMAAGGIALAFSDLFPPGAPNPYDAAKRLIDEFGRRARSVAMARSLVGLHQDNEVAALHWRNTFEAILHIQEPVGAAGARRVR
jgi:hypothetical protein